jgi:translation initiation factor IF-1
MLKLLKSKKSILVAIIVAILGYAGFLVAEQDVSKGVDLVLNQIEESTDQSSPEASNTPEVKEDFNRASHISDDRRIHILYGDATGGGHLHGQNKPCKSEFPKHWDENTIIKEVELIAANDNLNWEQQRNGYYVTEQIVGTVKVRVVKARNGGDVITAYPTNVQRNHCPANDH